MRRLHGSRRLQQRCERLRHWRQRLKASLQALPSQPPSSGPASATRSFAPGTLPSGALEHLAEAERLDLQRELEADFPALALLLDPVDSDRSLQRWRDPADVLLHPRSPLDGGQLQARLKLPPGPRLGRLIEHLTLERAFGRLPALQPPGPAEQERSLQAARSWWAATEATAMEATAMAADGPQNADGPAT